MIVGSLGALVATIKKKKTWGNVNWEETKSFSDGTKNIKKIKEIWQITFKRLKKSNELKNIFEKKRLIIESSKQLEHALSSLL